MEDLKVLINQVRNYTGSYRKTENVKNVDFFFLSMLEISSNLIELGIENGRKITIEEEENWFKGSYHLDFWDSEINTQLYVPMMEKVKKLNFFRP